MLGRNLSAKAGHSNSKLCCSQGAQARLAEGLLKFVLREVDAGQERETARATDLVAG